MAQFKVGDVVHLKSGSPEMTVNGIVSSGGIQCVWFAGDDKSEKVETYVFAAEALTLRGG